MEKQGNENKGAVFVETGEVPGFWKQTQKRINLLVYISFHHLVLVWLGSTTFPG